MVKKKAYWVYTKLGAKGRWRKSPEGFRTKSGADKYIKITKPYEVKRPKVSRKVVYGTRRTKYKDLR